MNQHLAKSYSDRVSDDVLQDVENARRVIQEMKEDEYPVGLLHITADLLHVGHIQYVKTAREQMFEMMRYPCKIVVGVEADDVSFHRKGKRPIYSQEERKYIMQNLQDVDHAFVYHNNAPHEKRPYGTSLYLEPDVLISHEEYYPNGAEEEDEIMRENGGRFLVIKNSDMRGTVWRDEIGRSTSKTLQQVLGQYGEG